jgi:protein-L-isoaspartate(D-aspartate) O-methyltransferase
MPRRREGAGAGHRAGCWASTSLAITCSWTRSRKSIAPDLRPPIVALARSGASRRTARVPDALMVEALSLAGSERVLEIGTGHGFQTALLARLAAFVWSVERWPDLAATARRNLAREGFENVDVVVGDGSEGLVRHAPFDAILVSAAFTRVPQPLSDQLVPGGRLLQPIGPGGNEDVILFEREPEQLVPRRTVIGAHFVELRGRHGSPGARDEEVRR